MIRTLRAIVDASERTRRELPVNDAAVPTDYAIPNVVPMETAEPSDRCDTPDCLRRAMERRILVECKVRAHPNRWRRCRFPKTTT
jgi:hypothetical protein